MSRRPHLGLFSCLAVVGLGAAACLIGCSGDDNSPAASTDGGPDSSVTGDASPPVDSGAKDATAAQDAAKDTGAADTGQPDGGDAAGDGGLTARAQAGLAASPFTLATAGLTTAQLEQLGVGSYIVNVSSVCPDCHNNPAAAPGKGFLAGGNQFGPVKARNLTSDVTHGLRMSEAQFLEVLQTGKDQKLSPAPDAGADAGSPVALIVMPWEDFRWMAPTDMKAIYAYLQQVPADSNDVTPTVAGGPPIPMPTTFTDGAQTTAPALPAETGDAPLFAARGRAIQPLVEPAGVASLSAADQAAYGRGAYLATSNGICGECHTNPERPSQASTKLNTAQWLTGGRVFAAPPPAAPQLGVDRSMSADLLGATHGFIFQQGSDAGADAGGMTMKVDESVFTTTLQKHVHADDPAQPQLAWPMPKSFQKLLPEDIHALWVFLSSQAPVTGAADKATQEEATYCAASDASATGVCPAGSTCNLTANECLPTACSTDADCFACQTCVTGACALPAPTADGGANACVANGI